MQVGSESSFRLDSHDAMILVTEVLAAEMEIHMQGIEVTVPQHRGTKQGSVEGPRVFAQVLASALRSMV